MTNIIGFAGRKQSGKTTSCEYVKQLMCQASRQISDCGDFPIKIYNFADPLKQLCIDILGLTEEQCYGTDDNKNEKVECYRNYAPDGSGRMTARQVLQYVGTDIFRKMQHNVWSAATIRLIEKEKPKLALIADCRFPNEVEAIKNAGGLVIKLNRNLYQSTHESETALDDGNYDQSNFDLVIANLEGSIAEKNNIIKNFLIHKGILTL